MSRPRVEIVYFSGCPHVDAARAAVRRALAAAGLDARWREWDRDDPHTPEALCRYGSPTVLVDGRDVDPAPADANCCRLYAQGPVRRHAPAVETIRAALARPRPGGLQSP